MKTRAAALFGLKVLVSAALLALVLAKVDFGAILDVLARADLLLVLLWYLLLPIIISLTARRWQVLAPGLAYGTAVKYTWIGVFFGSVLPGSISGDVAKGVSLALKDANARAGLAASIVAEKVIGLAALLVFFDIACIVVYAMYGTASPRIGELAILALVLSLLGAAGCVAMAIALGGRRREGRGGFLGRVIDGLRGAWSFYANKPALLVRAFTLSVWIHVLNIVAVYVSFLALDVPAGALFAAVVYPIVSVILLVPISISGIGVRDATLAALFAIFGLPPASGVALSWLNLLSTIPNILIGGAVQLWEMYRPRQG